MICNNFTGGMKVRNHRIKLFKRFELIFDLKSSDNSEFLSSVSYIGSVQLLSQLSKVEFTQKFIGKN